MGNNKGISALFGDDLDLDINDLIKKEPEIVEEKLELEPGVTVIGKKTGSFNGEIKDFTIYYGNYVDTLVNGKFIVIKNKEYLQMLDEFFNTDEGRKYRRPTEKEIKEADKLVQTKVNNHLASIGNSRKIVSTSTLQPGRTQEAINKTIEEDNKKEGIVTPPVPPVQKPDEFIDDPLYRESDAGKIVQENFNSKAKLRQVEKQLGYENRRNARRAVIFTLFAVLILGIAIFIGWTNYVARYQTIEIELKSESITLKQGEPFIAQNYLESVTEVDNIYVIYPTLDTNGLGTYELEYVATNNTKSVKKVLTVEITDGTAPVITLTKDEILLVRERDEEELDLLSFVDVCEDDVDGVLVPKHTPLDWNRNEQVITYQVFDKARNQATAQLTVHIEDKAECVKNATYDPETNTCSCNDGYTGDGTEACKLIPKSSSSSSNSSSSGSGSSGNSSSSSSGSSGSSGSGSSGGSSTPTQPSTPTPPPATPRIEVSGGVTVSVGSNGNDVAPLAAGCVAYASSSYQVNCSGVNTTIAGSYACTITGSDGASATVPVTVSE